MKYLLILLTLFSNQVIAGVKIRCTSITEMDYHQVKTLDNQSAKDEWKERKIPHTLNIELINDQYLMVNDNKAPIVMKSAGVLYLTTSIKELPGTNKKQGTVVMVSLAVNMAIPSVTKTSLMTKYFLSSEIQATATNYECRFNN